jgi:hypothetical protein
MTGRHDYHAWPRCGAFARSTGQPCRRKVAVGEDGRPRPRCLGHGAHVLSGKQTPEGRQRIANATRRRMLSFWEAWRKAGKPPLPWRESLRTAHAKPKPPTLAEWRAEKQRKWDEDAEQRRERIVADLKRRYPHRHWS